MPPENAQRSATPPTGDPAVAGGAASQDAAKLIDDIDKFVTTHELPGPSSAIRPIADLIASLPSGSTSPGNARTVDNATLTACQSAIESLKKVEQHARKSVSPEELEAADLVLGIVRDKESRQSATETLAQIDQVVSARNSPRDSPHATPELRPNRPRSGSVSSIESAAISSEHVPIESPPVNPPQTATNTTHAAENNDIHETDRNAAASLWSHVRKNETTDPARQITYSVLNSALRNVASVVLPTFLRQILAEALANGMQHMDENARIALGITAGLIPPVLLAVGDRINEEKTPGNTAARLVLALTAIGATATAAGRGTLSTAAPSLIAYLVYASMRDGVQRFVRLGNPDADPQLRITTSAQAGAAYILNQTAIGALMGLRESPSGAGAAGQPGIAVVNAIKRALTNGLGETLDDLTLAVLMTLRPPRLTYAIEGATSQQIVSTATTTYPARASLGMASTLAAGIAAAALAGTNLSDNKQTNLVNFFGALTLGVLYPALIHIHEQWLREPGTTPPDLEAGPIVIIEEPVGSIPLSNLQPTDASETASHSPSVLVPPQEAGNVSLGVSRPASSRTSTHSREPSAHAAQVSETGNVTLGDGRTPQSSSARTSPLASASASAAPTLRGTAPSTLIVPPASQSNATSVHEPAPTATTVPAVNKGKERERDSS
ncbi:hypothetical protein [Paraburkholderia humisilvae]|uniref:hypothetical protein n=1 Tax=Paraburkholderia humisilvae TaxID=627669 RepID=UPI001582F68B|nr:hypothetical protein [Paraburkholderia humisilvae]